MFLFDYLPAILNGEDRNSMAWAVESRLPFLDHRIVEFARSLPGDHLCRNGWTKAVLRKALEGFVPEEVLRRPRKLGLPGPFEGRRTVPPEMVAAARRRLIDGGWFPAAMIPDAGAGIPSRVALRIRLLDAWARACLDAPGSAATAPREPHAALA